MKFKTIFMAFLMCCASGIIACSNIAHAKIKQVENSESIYNLQDSWTDQDNKSHKLSDFKNKPVVLAMVYTSCHGACPLTVADIQKIEKGLSENERARVQFLLFSFDTEKDKPTELKEFAKAHALDLTRWSLLTGQSDAVRDLAAVIGVQYKKNKDGEFSHSNVISILDTEGKIQHQQIGLGQNPSDSIKILKNLISKK